MARTVRIEPLAQTLRVMVDAGLDPRERGAVVARFARAELGKVQQRNAAALGRVPRHEQFVDGRRAAALESVRTTIVFEFEVVDHALAEIGRMLVEASPVVSGAYHRGHKLFADGVEVPIGAVLPMAEEYVYTNVVPYARRLEIGKRADGTPFVVQVEPNIYERVGTAARARFGNMVRIKHTYRAVAGGYLLKGKLGDRSPLRNPALVVTVR